MEDDYVSDFWCCERKSLWTRIHMVKSFLDQSNIHVFWDIFIATSHDLSAPLSPVESSLREEFAWICPDEVPIFRRDVVVCFFLFSVLKFFFFVSFFE